MQNNLPFSINLSRGSYWPIIIIFLVFFLSCEKEDPHNIPLPEVNPEPYDLIIPEGMPTMPEHLHNPLTKEGVALGRKLYYDRVLHVNELVSCGDCHVQKFGFTSPQTNVLPHINLGWNRNYMWNGNHHLIDITLEEVCLFEVEEFMKTDIDKLNAHPGYPDRFYESFGVNQISSKEVAFALAQFIRTLISGNSLYDKVLYGGPDAPLFTDEQMRGYDLFFSEEGDCFHCHGNHLFTDNNFYNIGLDKNFEGSNKGLYLVTANPADLGKFKVPTLRNAALRSNFMHDGRFGTLEEVINHYNNGVQWSPTLDPVMTKPGKELGLGLSQDEVQALVAFLHTLIDEQFISDPKYSNPFN